MKSGLAALAGNAKGRIRQLQLIAYLSLILNAILIGLLTYVVTFSISIVFLVFIFLGLTWVSILKILGGE